MDGFKIFDSDPEKPILPDEVNTNNNDIEDLKSQCIEDAITGEVVKSVLLEVENSIVIPNYVIDMSELKEIEPIQVNALDSLLNENGDVVIYIYLNGNLQKIGMANSWVIHRIIVPAISTIFNNKCKIYKDFQVGKELNIINTKSIAHLRLSI